ncbi:hypothetical protein K458DRAFT_392176 [Lentithecium fluviatile CBS 122367]|uniref:Uncharacterized protein n=1 Tax=Lentithecium fluviatile CBS 122367 TaxID=1168545 RepID=A0A6G1IT15_9PLEO|nr:hypothetical protein K458DRAFT_409261 [Lentithecium fluviatile CBS 122367]KAF2681386.1 hypothetical protein K458DRAFT_392176 [Lentithecium fluviatile CBS 122367]
MQSTNEIKSVLRKQAKLLHQIVANIVHLRRTHFIEAPSSIFEEETSQASIFDRLPEEDREPDSLDFTFDTLVLDSQVYEKTFAASLDAKKGEDSGETRTLTDASSLDDRTIRYDAVNTKINGKGKHTTSSLSPITNSTAPRWSLWPEAPSWVYSFLDVESTSARTRASWLVHAPSGILDRSKSLLVDLIKFSNNERIGCIDSSKNYSGPKVGWLVVINVLRISYRTKPPLGHEGRAHKLPEGSKQRIVLKDAL